MVDKIDRTWITNPNKPIPEYCKGCPMILKALINKNPEIFQETVFDRLNPKLEEIKLEIEFLKDALKDFKIRGLKLRSTRK